MWQDVEALKRGDIEHVRIPSVFCPALYVGLPSSGSYVHVRVALINYPMAIGTGHSSLYWNPDT
jgi:hypothetical protein